jgi:hypothetical protein
MDVTDFQDGSVTVAIATCDDFAALGEALAGMATAGAEGVVVRNGGPVGRAELARFAAALLTGAREAQREATTRGRTR